LTEGAVKGSKHVEDVLGLDPGKGKFAFIVTIDPKKIKDFRRALPNGHNKCGAPEFLVNEIIKAS